MSSDRKKDILAAAGKCFVKFGYDKTTLDDIAGQVGINKASFYYYFKNKEAIFIDLIIREADEFIKAVKNKVDSVSGCREKIISWIKESFRYNESNSILHQLSIESLKKLTPQLAQLKEYAKEKGTEYLCSVLTYYQEKGRINTDNVLKVAQTIQNIIYAMKDHAYHASRFNPDETEGFDKMVDEIIFAVSLILDGIIIEGQE